MPRFLLLSSLKLLLSPQNVPSRACSEAVGFDVFYLNQISVLYKLLFNLLPDNDLLHQVQRLVAFWRLPVQLLTLVDPDSWTLLFKVYAFEPESRQQVGCARFGIGCSLGYLFELSSWGELNFERKIWFIFSWLHRPWKLTTPYFLYHELGSCPFEREFLPPLEPTIRQHQLKIIYFRGVKLRREFVKFIISQ